MEIETFKFDKIGLDELEKQAKGKNWPVLYLIHNDDEIYVGETTSAHTRMQQHLKNPKKSHLNIIEIVFDDLYNKSVILDFEQRLIKYIKVDSKYKKVLNANLGQSSSHDYFDRANYKQVFKNLWDNLENKGLVSKSLDKIENEAIFKFSPYTSLTEEQNAISIDIIRDILYKLSNGERGISLVNGCAGTGKTLLAISIINCLINAAYIEESEFTKEQLATEKISLLLELKDYIQKTKPLKIGFVFPMAGIRATIGDVFKKIGNGLNKKMVINPYVRQDYDILFVDEAHRLSRRKSLSNYKPFKDTCDYYGLDENTANQLDFIIKSSKYKVLFYDEDQSVRLSDATHLELFKSLRDSGENINTFELETQMRCQAGTDYAQYLKNIFNCRQNSFLNVNNYEFKVFKDVDTMVKLIIQKDEKYGLSKNVAGFSWKWETQKGLKRGEKVPNNMDRYNDLLVSNKYDIEIDGHKYIWNITTDNWINREDSRYTIGCIHTTQGYDLNYVGVIFGEEIDYDPIKNEITIDISKVQDAKTKETGIDPNIVKKYMINAYRTMMLRGIKGCYVYACNKGMREYLKKFAQWGD